MLALVIRHHAPVLLAQAGRSVGWRSRKVGGLRFLALGRLRLSFCLSSQGNR